MNLLIIGLTLFFLIHLVPSFTGVRRSLIKRLGENPYRGLFSLISLIGLGLIAVGMGRREVITLWQPPVWSSHLTILLMIPAFILLAAAYLPGNVKRFTRHPMLWGVSFWAMAHLSANGDVGSMLLFGCFLIYSLFDMWSANRRGAKKSTEKRSVIYDVGVIIVGFLVYLLFFFLHPYIIGVPILIM